MKKTKAKLLQVKVECLKDRKIYEIPEESISWYADSTECELCGSHGSVELSFTCGCGETHDLEVNSW